MTARMLQNFGSALLGLAFLFGCVSSQPTEFYTLSSQASGDEAVKRSMIRLGVGPITLPAYLDRPQMVSRSGDHRLNVADFDQWAEPLETSVQRVVIDNLSTALGSDDVVKLPNRRDLSLDYQVEIDVARFDADEAGAVILDARWLIFDGRGDRLQESGRSIIERKVATPDKYTAIAAAMSRCLGAMSEDIASSLAAL